MLAPGSASDNLISAREVRLSVFEKARRFLLSAGVPEC
jgi:hypothetical protein